jgi:hypothetical protein
MWLTIAEARAGALVLQRTGAEADEAPLVQAWLNRAWELAGDSSGEQSDEALIDTLPAAPAASRVPVDSGTMILFAAGMFLLVLVGPGVAGGRRQSRQVQARAARRELPARARREPAGSRLQAAR